MHIIRRMQVFGSASRVRRSSRVAQGTPLRSSVDNVASVLTVTIGHEEDYDSTNDSRAARGLTDADLVGGADDAITWRVSRRARRREARRPRAWSAVDRWTRTGGAAEPRQLRLAAEGEAQPEPGLLGTEVRHARRGPARDVVGRLRAPAYAARTYPSMSPSARKDSACFFRQA